jgi:hypothetical protein
MITLTPDAPPPGLVIAYSLPMSRSDPRDAPIGVVGTPAQRQGFSC